MECGNPLLNYMVSFGGDYIIYIIIHIYIIIYNKIHKIIYTYENFGEGISMD